MASFDTPFPSGLVDWEKSQIRMAIKEKLKKELNQEREDSKLLAELLQAALDDLKHKKA